jgi:hypothetical protein
VLVSFSVLFVDSSGLLYRIESIDQNRRAILEQEQKVRTGRPKREAPRIGKAPARQQFVQKRNSLAGFRTRPK